ncbi:type IV secretion system protein TraC [soil metagenome]
MFTVPESVTQFTEKVASWFGEKADWGISHLTDGNEPVPLSGQYPLQSLLPYEVYDPTSALFINKKSMGFILEASCLTGSTEEIENILTSLITDVLPTQADLQFILHGSDKIGDILDNFVAERSGHGETFEWLAKERTNYLKKGTLTSLASSGSFILRDFKLYIVLSVPKKNVLAITEQLTALRQDLQSSLKSINIYTRNIPIDNFISWLYDLINPTENCYARHESWNKLDALYLQLTDPEYRLRVYSNKLLFDTEEELWDVRCFTVRNFPKKMAQWKMTESIGQIFNNALQMPSPFVVSLSIRALDHETSAAKSQMKFINKDSTAKSPLAKFKPNADKEFQDWNHVRTQLAEGDCLVKIYYQVVSYARAKDANSVERKVRDLYRANGWKLRKERFTQFQSWLAMLPMMTTEGLYQDLKLFGRLRTMTAFNAMTIAPLQGEWKGTKRHSLLLPGRRGQIAIWNPFDNMEGNYNVAIAAKSGSGKSVFTQEYIVSLVGSGGRVWVIDVGRSYEKTCRMLNGEFIEFSQANPVSINPFTFISNFDDALELLKPLTAAMARPNSKATDEELAWLEKALKEAWKLNGNDATMTTVMEWLASQNDPLCKNLSHLLYPYSREGMYGRFFEGSCSINLNNPFVVLELEELKAKKDLQRIVLLVLMYQISECMYLGNRSQMKSCVIDEAWDLMDEDNESTAKFVETGYRRARRYYGNFVTITQAVNDYFKNKTSIAAYENSDYMIILGQKTESIDQLKESKRLNMDPYTERLFKSLKKTDEYSELIIKGPSGLSVHRLILDPYSRILYSSKGDEFDAVKYNQAQGKSLHESISLVARKFNHV